jgi:hypothetical protein
MSGNIVSDPIKSLSHCIYIQLIFFSDLSIPMDPDLTVHSVSSTGGRVHFGSGDKVNTIIN